METKQLDKEKRNSVAILPRHHPCQGCVYICERAGQAEALHPQPAPRVAPGPGQRESGAARVRSDQSSRDRGPSHIQSVTSVTQWHYTSADKHRDQQWENRQSF